MNRRLRFRTIPPTQLQVEVGQWASELVIDDLRLAQAIIEAELDMREGRRKFVLPDHVQAMLN